MKPTPAIRQLTSPAGRALARSAWTLAIPLGIAGCASRGDWSKEPLPISVSAANYSQASGEDLYMRVNGTPNTHPAPFEAVQPTEPLFYAFVPADYSGDVSMETVYRELATPLAHRGYFNIVYQVKAGLLPKRIDYLLRVHCGELQWRTPTVRTDKVTWGDDDLMPNWHGTSMKSGNLIGPYSHWDPRAGMTPAEVASLAAYFQQGQLAGSPTMNTASEHLSAGFNDLTSASISREYAIILVNAFKFDDVMRMKRDAPCIWSTFMAVPLRQGLDFSKVLRVMAQTATPYFGMTTSGLQVYETPPGKVIMGEPVEVPGPQKTPPPPSAPSQ
jgi:hypothetical protein